ncbi:MAG TPA: GGDEF domain-containing protein, partial [Anaerolineales bacterium]|nr:GGDEF domain-containing protein [Anaerolineales bacterium]
DSLTEVFNRRYFFEVANHEFEMAKRYQRPLSIVMFDIDNFKQFNDTHGHQAGDELLKCVAEIARQQLRDADILARYGGDEFVLLLSNSNAREAVIVAERVQESIAAYLMEMKHYQASLTISMGIAEFLSGVDSIDQLVQHADKALYNAKNAGRNCVIVYREEAD